MKITVLMPTYNDGESIIETLESLSFQTYKNWELLIMDDGSTDNTQKVIHSFITNNKSLDIQYFYQENQDQLSALENLIPHITGDLVYILHSDDLLEDCTTFQSYIDFIYENPNYDAYYGDLILIDGESNKTGARNSPGEFKKNNRNLATTYLWLGRNLYVDLCYFKVEIFKSQVKKNYLVRNVPFWFSKDLHEVLNIKKTDIPMFLYRTHADNYINNKVGLSVVLSGNIRVFTALMSKFYVPMFKSQYTIFRTMNKLKLEQFFSPVYKHKQEKNLYENLDFAISKRLGKDYESNLFFSSLANFFKNINESRTLQFDFDKKIMGHLIGRNAKNFFKSVEDGTVDPLIVNFMSEMKRGFNKITVDEKDSDLANKVLDFFCILDFVEIETR